MTDLATVFYNGDKPYILIKVQPQGRMCFNKHNNYSLQVPPSVAQEVIKQWGRFFTADIPAPLPEPFMLIAEDPVLEPVVFVEERPSPEPVVAKPVVSIAPVSKLTILADGSMVRGGNQVKELIAPPTKTPKENKPPRRKALVHPMYKDGVRIIKAARKKVASRNKGVTR